MKVNVYLNFAGNTEEAFNFYKSVFGGEFTLVQKYKDTPQVSNISESDAEKLMHISLPIGDSTLMGTDALESMGQKVTAGNNFSISITPTSKEEADVVFNRLSEGGTITMPIADAFWGAYFGMTTDKFGIQWMINLDHK